MVFDQDQLSLVTAAEEFVTYSLNDGGTFLLFGLVTQPNGEVNLAQPSDEFGSEAEALAALKAHLHELAVAGMIRACLVCQPIVAVNQIAAVFFHAESVSGEAAAFVSRCKRQSDGVFHLYGRDKAPVAAFAFTDAQQGVQGPTSPPSAEPRP